jgi:DNA-binding response OmpR family regulator
MRILVIEDNEPVAEAIRSMLESRKFAVDTAHDGDTGLDYLLRDTYDLAIVDIGLPKMHGFDVTTKARAERVRTPILILTARDAVEDRVHGLQAGADDYLIKPFEQEELLARVQAILRRGTRPIVSSLQAGDLRVDLAAREAWYANQRLSLGATEFRLLEFLARNPNAAFTRAQLIEHVWDYEFDGSSNIVDVYVSQLRRKLKRAGADHLIATVWGVGYKLST